MPANNSLLNAALEYATLGWPVFPCRHDKSPYTAHGHHDATTDPATLREWWQRWPGANIGFSPGSAGLLALDYDPGHRPAEVRHAIPDLPETGMTVRTPRGGEHHYYALDEADDPVPSTASAFAERVDVRSFGGYVLLPPSATKDGGYEWLGRKKPAYRSPGLLDACGRARGRSEHSDDWVIEPDLPENVDLARAWLRGERAIGSSWSKAAIQGAGGDNTTYATAAMMKSCGISEGTALELVWEHWNPRCDPPWDYDDLAGKIRNGYSYNTSPPGNVTPAYHVAKVAGLFQPAKIEALGPAGRQVTSGRFRFVDGPGLKAISPPEWLLPDFLPKDAYGMLVGAPGSYKTAIALDAALAIATGGSLFAGDGWRGLWGTPTETGPVLYVAGEGRAGLRQRAEAWCWLHLGHDDVPRDFILADPVPRVGEGGLEAFIDGALKLAPNGYSLIVLDTVARAMQGLNENASENATGFTAVVDTLRGELGGGVLALHHSGHENQDRARGSSAFLGDVDTMIVARRQEGNTVRLSMAKQKDWPEWPEARWCGIESVTLPDGRETFATVALKRAPVALHDTSEAVANTVVDRFLADFLRAHPLQEFTAGALAKRLAYHEMTTDSGERVTLGLGESTLRKDRLKKLRAPGSGALTEKMYDPAKDRWRYSPRADFSPV